MTAQEGYANQPTQGPRSSKKQAMSWRRAGLPELMEDQHPEHERSAYESMRREMT